MDWIIANYLFVLLGIFVFMSGMFTIKQQTVAILERFGKFHSIRKPGLHFKIPGVDKISGKISLKIQQLDVNVETKTKDNVFVKIKVSVQFKVLEEKAYDAFYKLDNPTEQITAYVFDTIRAEVPKLRLDDVFERKDDIAVAIRRELEEAMNTYGYGIVKALVTDIDPDHAVKNAMNRINAAEREKIAAEYEGESERGIADQRREIARGLEESVHLLNKVGINSQEASALIVVTQHYDTLQSLSEKVNSNLILLPNSPTTASDMLNSTITSFAASHQLGEQLKLKNPMPKLEEKIILKE